MTVTHFDNKEDWLAYRIANKEDYYGASEAAKACGLLPWEGCSPADMYMEKVGLKPIKDISEKERVRYGTEAEEHITALFALDYLNVFKVDTAPWDVLSDDKFPFIKATLDGYLEYIPEEPWELTSPTGYTGTITKGMKGNYEGKTALLRKKDDLVAWEQAAPDYYLAQLCQQLYVRREEAKFVFINSMVELPSYRKVGGEWQESQFNYQQIVRHVYFMDDPVVRASIKFVIENVVKHHKQVKARQMPDRAL